MIRSLSYKVTFPSTGRTFSNEIEFAPGLTAITGRNEAGKSLIIEMISYALFGKAALRANSSEYEGLKVELHLDVMDRRVRIIRQPKYEQLVVNGEEVALGAEALNKTIPVLLGFDMAVFNATIAAQQDNLNLLTEMRPTARAKMVDDLTGMDRLENAEKDCKTKAKQESIVAQTKALHLSPEIEPERPADYEPEELIRHKLNELIESQSLRDTLLAIKQPQAPVAPVKPDILESLEELEAIEEARAKDLAEKQRLEQALAMIPVPTVSLEHLQAFERYLPYKQELDRRGPKPVYSSDQLDEIEEHWKLVDFKGSVCPNCGFSAEEVVPPELSRTQIAEQRVRIDRWKEPLEEVEHVHLSNYEEEKAAHSRSEERRGYQQALESFVITSSRSSDIRELRAYSIELARYEAQLELFNRDYAAWSAAQYQLESMPDNSDRVRELMTLLSTVVAYEKDLAHYWSVKLKNDQIRAEIKKIEETVEGYTNAAKAIKATRNEMKQELAPSISKAASTLLEAMTNGERKQVVVDYEFNVWVDGQPLHTLSGSGKAVVNLALRIGMGRVLTSKVLSVFIGDEIDGSMDQSRADSTHNTFRELAGYLGQVILVTHKSIDADHIITL